MIEDDLVQGDHNRIKKEDQYQSMRIIFRDISKSSRPSSNGRRTKKRKDFAKKKNRSEEKRSKDVLMNKREHAL